MARTLDKEIADIQQLLQDREGAGGSLAEALQKARRRLPRRIYKQGLLLADATAALEHPKLRSTVDEKRLLRAAREVRGHLKQVDLADRRKGRVLQILGSIAFSLIAVVVLLIVVLRWRGFI